jgi:signal transduction histidine kinase/CheY-like chemotaxis protein
MNIKILFLLCSLIICSNTLYSQDKESDIDKYHQETTRFNEKELDSVSYIMLEYFNKGIYEKILQRSPALIQNAEAIEAYSLELRFRNILGSTFIKLDDTKNAEIFFSQALQTAKKRNDSIGVVMMYISLANTYFDSDTDKSLAYFNKVLEYNYNGERSEDSKFIIHHNLAEIYVKEKNINKAKYHLNKIIDKSDQQQPAVRRKGYLGTMKYITACINLLEKQWKLAVENSLESLKYKDDYEVAYLIGNYENLIVAYEELGEYKKLTEVHKEYNKLKDLKYEQDKLEQQQKAQAEVNFDNIEKELRASQLENELVIQKSNESDLYLLFFILLALLLLIASILLLRAKNKRDRLLKGLIVKNKQYLEAKEKSEKLAQSNTRFLSTISHELRTPLYGIVGLSSSFLEDPILFKYKEEFRSLQFSADYLLALVNDVLHINKFSSEEGKKLNEVHFDLVLLIDNIKKSFKFLNEKHNNKVIINLDPNLPDVLYGDKTKISQVLMNLMSNASKFTEDGTIELKIEKIDGIEDHVDLLFKIIDTGRGIHPDHQKSVFEEFTQVEESFDKGINGTGLGLSIVNKILKILESSLKMKSVYNEGTTISFTLQIKIGKKDQLEKLAKSADITFLKNKKVLIVDDNRINQLVTKKVLEKHHIMHDTANNGMEAVVKVKDNYYDFILMDINMPIMNGIDATQKIREFNQITPIIALTATNFANPENEVYRFGINSIIVKPYETDHLLQSLLREL